MSARRANRRLVTVPDTDDAEQRQRIERLCVNVARAVAVVRNLPDNEDAELIAEFLVERNTEFIEFATGAVNERGHHYGAKSLKTARNSMLVRANVGFASRRAFRDAFEDYYKHRFNRDGPPPIEHPDCWFFEALRLIEEVPALSTVHDILRENRVSP